MRRLALLLLLGGQVGCAILDALEVPEDNTVPVVVLPGCEGNVAPLSSSINIANSGSTVDQVVLGDFDGDGHHDVAVIGLELTVLYGDAINGPINNTPGAVTSFGLGPATRALAADVDGDGIDDVVLLLINPPRVSVFLGSDQRTLGAPLSTVGMDPVAMAVGELAASSLGDDVVIVNGTSPPGNLFVLGSMGGGTLETLLTRDAMVDPLAVAVGDADGDGSDDIAFVHDDGVSVLLQLSPGDFSIGPPLIPEPDDGFYSDLVFADVDGDGHDDLFVMVSRLLGAQRDLRLLLNRGVEGFELVGDVRPANDFAARLGMIAGDVNGDTRADLILPGSSQAGLDLSILVTSGGTQPRFRCEQTAAIGTTFDSPRGVSARDVNGDGRTDLAVATGTVGAVMLLSQ